MRHSEFDRDEYVHGAWNTKYAGREALTTIGKSGYMHGTMLGKSYSAHRVIWVMVNGGNPKYIDHINGDKLDNRLSNLRAVTPKDSAKNMPMCKTNNSGVTGVRWYKRTSRWRSEIFVNGKYIHLGYFKNKFDAILARLTAEKEHDFHPNHGRSA